MGREVVLGNGILMVTWGPDRDRTSLHLWDLDRMRRIYFTRGRRVSGTLIWRPDPRPERKGGKR